MCAACERASRLASLYASAKRMDAYAPAVLERAPERSCARLPACVPSPLPHTAGVSQQDRRARSRWTRVTVPESDSCAPVLSRRWLWCGRASFDHVTVPSGEGFRVVHVPSCFRCCFALSRLCGSMHMVCASSIMAGKRSFADNAGNAVAGGGGRAAGAAVDAHARASTPGAGADWRQPGGRLLAGTPPAWRTLGC